MQRTVSYHAGTAKAFARLFGRSGYRYRTYAEEQRLLRTRSRVAAAGVLAAVVLALPAVLSPYSLNVVNLVLLAIPGAVALNLLTGIGGQISIGNAAFMAIGAYACAFVAHVLGGPAVAGLALAVLLAGFLGFVVGLPALRVRGIYLLISSLALHYITLFAVSRFQSHTVGERGFTLAFSGPLALGSARWWYATLAAFALLVCWLAHNLMRSKIGRAWEAMRDRDIAAGILGIDVGRQKLLAFVVSSAVIGLQGALHAYYLGIVVPDVYRIDTAISFIAMIVIGGLGSIPGAVLGAALITLLPFAIQAMVPAAMEGVAAVHILQSAAYGLTILFFLIVEPNGLHEVWRRAKRYVVLWPYARAYTARKRL